MKLENTTFGEVFDSIKKSNAKGVGEQLYDYLIRRIKNLRQQKELTQESFAERAQISYKYYQAIEAGRKRDLRLSTLSKLAEAHQLSLGEFLDFQMGRTTARHPASYRPTAVKKQSVKKTPKKKK